MKKKIHKVKEKEVKSKETIKINKKYVGLTFEDFVK